MYKNVRAFERQKFSKFDQGNQHELLPLQLFTLVYMSMSYFYLLYVLKCKTVQSGNIEKEVIFAVTSRIALVSQELVTQEFCLSYNTFMCCYI